MLSFQDWLESVSSPEIQDKLPRWGAFGSTVILRVLAYIFLRWIPGHPFPPLILIASIVYAASYYLIAFDTNKLDEPLISIGGDDGFDSILSAEEQDGEELESSPEQTEGLQITTVNDEAQVLIVEEQALAGEATGTDKSTSGRLRSRKTRKKFTDSLIGEPKRSVKPPKVRKETVLRTLLSGVPSSRFKRWNIATAVINGLLALMVLDLTMRAPLFYPSHDLSFARVGYVDEHNAKILVREPDAKQLPVYVSYREATESSWTTAEKIYLLSEDQDFTRPLTISGLQHSTTYEYSTSNGHGGRFLTAAPVGQMQKGKSTFTFLTSSCIKPHFPYTPFSHPLHIPGLDHLSSLIPQLQASFMLFLGDFIYIDVPLRFGYKASTYRREYRQVYASPSWEAATKDLPWLHTLDDHEIANDWDKGVEAPYPAALDPWLIYHDSVNPSPLFANTTYYSFKQGPASFFMMDSRRYRTRTFDLPADDPDKSMLGAAQLDAVLTWLKRPEPSGVHWKVLVSSVPFTRNWRVNAQDTWAGYLVERQLLLEAMWDAVSSPSAPGIVILSGDRHEFAATRFPAPAETEQMQLARTFGDGSQRWSPRAVVHEFSCSPLSMFYLPVRSYWEVSGQQSGVGNGGEDQCVEYVPDGNSKFGAVEIENAKGSTQSTLKYRLFVDGEERWTHVLTSGEPKGLGGRDAIWG